MDNKNSPIKTIFLFLTVIFLLLAVAAGIYGYFYAYEQQNQLNQKEKEVADLKNAQLLMQKQIDEIRAREKELALQNSKMSQQAVSYENEKNVILTQVRNSVGAFEVFRKEATDEIQKMKETVASLETQKKDLSDRLAETESSKKQERQNLEQQIGELNSLIEAHKKNEIELAKSLEAKERVPIVIQSAKLHYNLGNFYAKHKQYKQAVKEYRQALEYNPDDANIHYNLALVSDDYLGDAQAAIEHFKRYLELSPKAKDVKKIQLRVYDLEIQMSVKEENPKTTKMETFKTKPYELSGLKN